MRKLNWGFIFVRKLNLGEKFEPNCELKEYLPPNEKTKFSIDHSSSKKTILATFFFFPFSMRDENTCSNKFSTPRVSILEV